jgi:hypothetical protein
MWQFHFASPRKNKSFVYEYDIKLSLSTASGTCHYLEAKWYTLLEVQSLHDQLLKGRFVKEPWLLDLTFLSVSVHEMYFWRGLCKGQSELLTIPKHGKHNLPSWLLIHNIKLFGCRWTGMFPLHWSMLWFGLVVVHPWFIPNNNPIKCIFSFI